MRDLRASIETIRRDLGPDVLTIPADPAQHAIDGIEPLAVAQPDTPDRLARILRLAAKHRVPVVPRGAGYFSHLGGCLSEAGIVISLARLHGVVAYEPADLTITVQAGMTLRALQRHLAARRQCLPLDPPCPDDATIGGIVAANATGPSRFRYGTCTDMLLGLRAVAPTGDTLNAGGRVVKNVAGYDLTSLLVGSLGTLAVLTELTFKVWPRPAASAMVLGRCGSLEQAHEAAERLVSSQLQPTFVELLNEHALVGTGDPAPPAAHRAAIVTGFSGSASDIAYQLPQAELLLQDAGLETQGLVGDEEPAARAWLRDIIRRIATGPTGLVTLKLSVLSTDIPSGIAKAAQLASDFGLRCAAQAHAGNGIIYIVVEAPSPTDEPPERVSGLCEALCEEAERLGGWAVVERAPATMKQLAGAWGRGGRQHGLMTSIKQALDPTGILNPGRLTNAH